MWHSAATLIAWCIVAADGNEVPHVQPLQHDDQLLLLLHRNSGLISLLQSDAVLPMLQSDSGLVKDTLLFEFCVANTV